MVAPKRDLANTLFHIPTNPPTMSSTNANSSLPTVSFENDIGIDIPVEQVPVFDFEVRGRNLVSSVNLSRESSMASSRRATPYHDKMDVNMDCNSTIEELTPELSYETEQEKALWVDMAANHQDTTRPSDGVNKASPTHALHEEDVINIQLPYDPQAPTEPELWSGSFHPISLHGSIEHFALDSKNIKVSLNFLAKYIKNKQVNGSKANNLNNFDGMGDAI